MGALPRLKKKDELHYRKGSTNESKNCRFCVNIVKGFEVKGIGGPGAIALENRCKIMGLNASRRYRINTDFTCDAQVYNGKAEHVVKIQGPSGR